MIATHTGRTRTRWIALALAAIAATAVIAIIAWRSGYHAAISVKPAPIERRFALLTNQPGVEDLPSLAPDGKTFVFVSRKSGNADIYLQRVDGQNAFNLTRDSGVDNTQPAFSSDGSQIAFRSERDGGGIFIMGATGESVRRLTDFGFNPAWSANGSEIAISTSAEELAPMARDRESTIYAVSVQTGARRRIVDEAHDGVQPNWSPHGQRVVYCGWGPGGRGRSDVYTIDPYAANPTSTITRLTNDPVLHWNPLWSPDGKYVYFGSFRDGGSHLWRVLVDESSGMTLGLPEPVSLPTRYAAHFSFARNTGALVYAAVDLTDTLSRTPFDSVSLHLTGERSPLLGGAMLLWQGCAVSPDGNWIAFSNIFGSQDHIFIMRSDGSDLRQLTNDQAQDHGPSWSADGKSLYFYSDRGGRIETWSIRTDGSGLRQVSRTDAGFLWPKLMRDGRTLYGLNKRGTYLLPLNSDGVVSRAEPLPDFPDATRHFIFPALSPDGMHFVGVVVSEGGRGEKPGVSQRGAISGGSLWLYSLASRTYEQLTDHTARIPIWLPNGKGVLFVDAGKLFSIDLKTKKVLTIPLPRPIRGVSIAPDGRALYLHEQTLESHIWLMASSS